MEVRVCRASAVVVQKVPSAAADRFMQWQQGVTGAAERFVGYRGTDVYPPANGRHDEWVVVIHFDDEAALQYWLQSPVRAEWVQKLRKEIGDFRLTALPGGFAAWFAGAGGMEGALPPSWKIALSVLVGLYPTVMLLSIFVGPYISPLGLAVSMLISNALSCAILQWAVTPVLNPLLAPWLHPKGSRATAISVGGLVLILLVLGGLAALFHLITG